MVLEASPEPEQGEWDPAGLMAGGWDGVVLTKAPLAATHTPPAWVHMCWSGAMKSSCPQLSLSEDLLHPL